MPQPAGLGWFDGRLWRSPIRWVAMPQEGSPKCPNSRAGSVYLFSGSGCRAATTPPRAAAERLARTDRFAGSLCAAGRGAARRSATSSTTLPGNREGCGRRKFLGLSTRQARELLNRYGVP